jgi:hypothetical protein
VRGLRDAYRARGDLQAAGVEDLERRAKARALGAEAVGLRHEAIERDLEDVPAAHTHRRLGCAYAHAIGAAVHDERRNAAGAGRLVGLGVDDESPPRRHWR